MIVYKLMIMIMIIWNCNKDTVTAPTTVTGVTLEDSVTVVVGTSSTVVATVLPATATNPAVTWTTSDTTVATVSEGVITGESAGTATITAMTTDGGHTDTVVVTVTIAAAVTSVSFDKTTSSIVIDTKDTITVTIVYAVGGAAETVRWTSSDTTVATVDSNGVISGVLVGTAIITATATADTSKKATTTITVTATAVAVTGVTLDSSTVEIVEDSTARVVATVSPPTATNPAVTWTTSDTTVATVDANGIITGVSAGTANITVTTTDGSYTATVTVIVTAAPILVTGVTLNTSTVTVGENESVTVEETVIPSDATDKLVSWRSSNTAIATVDLNGVITGVLTGTANIIVTTTDGNFKDTVVVTVLEIISTGATITHTITEFYTNGGVDTASQIAAISDGDKTTNVNSEPYQVHIGNQSGATITHTFSNTYRNGIYTYYGRAGNAINAMNGATVTFMNGNTVVETVPISNPTKDITVIPDSSTAFNKVVTTFPTAWAAFYEIEILGLEAPPVSVTGVSVGSDTVNLIVGESSSVEATVLPIDAINQAVIWSSSVDSIATVDLNGVITAVSAGIVNIIVTTTDGSNIVQIVVVTVTPILVAGVTLNTNAVTVGENGSVTVEETVVPSDATDKSVSWRSNNTAIATVDTNGIITGVSIGTATITVTTVDQMETATVFVTVLENISTGATITHTISNFYTGAIDQASQIAAISNGDKTTVTSADQDYQVHIGNVTNATITHTFSKIYNNAVYTYYGRNRGVQISAMNGATVEFMNGSTVIETVPISNPTQDITVIPRPSTAFNKVVTTFPTAWAAFYEIEILGIEAIAPAGGIFSVEIIVPASYATKGYVSKGEDLQLSASVSAISGKATTVTWKSSDTTVVTVNSSGEVTGVLGGTATITAISTADISKTAELEITITVVSITGVTLDNNVVTVSENATATIVATVDPSDASNKAVTWTTSDAAVATVDLNGVITGVSAGTADIIVTTTDRNFKDTVFVTVEVPIVISVSLNKTTSFIVVGAKDTVTATVQVEGGAVETVTWTTSNANIATVDSSGIVTRLSGGVAIITATSTADPTKTAELRLTVLEIISTVGGSSAAIITHTITEFAGSIDAATQIAAISNGDKTTAISAAEPYQIRFTGPMNATITHTFSKIYNNGVYTYYAASGPTFGASSIAGMNSATVAFMNGSTVVETVTISNPTTQNIRVTPSPLTAFNKVVTTFPSTYGIFYEIEILAVEATQ